MANTLLDTLTESKANLLSLCDSLSYVKRSAVAAKRTARKGWRCDDAILVGADGTATPTDNEALARSAKRHMLSQRQQTCDSIARECRKMARAWAVTTRKVAGHKARSAEGQALTEYHSARFSRLAGALQKAILTHGGLSTVRRFLVACEPPADWSLTVAEAHVEVERAQRHALMGASPKGWLFTSPAVGEDKPKAKAPTRRRVTRSK